MSAGTGVPGCILRRDARNDYERLQPITAVDSAWLIIGALTGRNSGDSMKRYLALFGAAVLAVSSALGSVSAQTGVPVNADGSYVVANDDGQSTASGVGEDINYGDVMTGGSVARLSAIRMRSTRQWCRTILGRMAAYR